MTTCSICLVDIENQLSDTKTLSCGHKYHTTCINTWLLENNTCPYCRNVPLPSKFKKYTLCFVKSLYIISVLLLNVTLAGIVLQETNNMYDFGLCISVFSTFIILLIYNLFVSCEISASRYLSHLLEVLLIVILLLCVDILIEYNHRLKNKGDYAHLFIINLLVNISAALFYSRFRLVLFIKKYLIVQYYIDICN